MYSTKAPGDGLFKWATIFLGIWNQKGFFAMIWEPLTHAGIKWMPKVKDAWSYLWWLASPPASSKLHRIRNELCDSCPIMSRVNGRRYCGGCGCGQTKRAELTVKNSRIGHNCPLGRQPGSVAIIQLPVVPDPFGEGI